jgi:hypothetical protein
MNCEQAREQIVDRWTGRLAASDSAGLDDHLASCVACREEAEALAPVWRLFDDAVSAEAPSPAARARFQGMVEAYRLGAGRTSRRKSLIEILRSFWPARPAWQFGVACAFLVVGLAVGRLSVKPAPAEDPTRLARLSGEVRDMRRLVTVSLLERQSAADRLKGVDYSYRVESPEPEVLDALVRTLITDSNVNVRLAAFDAIARFAQAPRVRNDLRRALAVQDSPLVEIALIDWVADNRDRDSERVLREIAARPDVHPAVKQRVEQTLQRLR